MTVSKSVVVTWLCSLYRAFWDCIVLDVTKRNYRRNRTIQEIEEGPMYRVCWRISALLVLPGGNGHIRPVRVRQNP